MDFLEVLRSVQTKKRKAFSLRQPIELIWPRGLSLSVVKEIDLDDWKKSTEIWVARFYLKSEAIWLFSGTNKQVDSGNAKLNLN